GGGTADFSLVRLNSPKSAPTRGFLLKGWGQKTTTKANLQTQVIAKAGTALGGSDIDYWLQDYFCQTLNLQPSTWILRLAERLKIALSSQETATEVYFDDQALETYEFSLTRPQLEDILVKNGWFDRLEGLLNQVRQQALGQGIPFEQIDAVLLVGGASQTPSFQTWARQYFTPAQICGDSPLTAVAQGALQILQGRRVQDYLYHSYGVRYWNRRKNCHSWHPIIEAGQNYPMSQPVELTLGASLPNQPSIELIIGELGASSGAAEVYWDNGRLLTRSLAAEETQVYPLNDRPGARQIAQLDPPGAPGSDRVKVRFWVDEKRYLRLSVEDLLQQKILLQEQVVAQLS
ncbi:MAG: Hsp70 family protein, partial [Cyanobacteriota bacterium]|nr:Hsp70 family protein [Cyanobacteriota bacterium]